MRRYFEPKKKNSSTCTLRIWSHSTALRIFFCEKPQLLSELSYFLRERERSSVQISLLSSAPPPTESAPPSMAEEPSLTRWSFLVIPFLQTVSPSVVCVLKFGELLDLWDLLQSVACVDSVIRLIWARFLLSVLEFARFSHDASACMALSRHCFVDNHRLFVPMR